MFDGIAFFRCNNIDICLSLEFFSFWKTTLLGNYSLVYLFKNCVQDFLKDNNFLKLIQNK